MYYVVAWFTHSPKGKIWFHSMLHGKSHTFMVNRCGDGMQAFRPLIQAQRPVFNQFLYQLMKYPMYIIHNSYWAWLVSTIDLVCTMYIKFLYYICLILIQRPSLLLTSLGIEHKASSAVQWQCTGHYVRCTVLQTLSQRTLLVCNYVGLGGTADVIVHQYSIAQL